METRTCKVCGIEKEIKYFSFIKNSVNRRKVCQYCNSRGKSSPEMIRAYHQEYRRRKKIKGHDNSQSAYRIEKRYGLKPTQYQAILKNQNGVCAICFKPPSGIKKKHLNIDHCHKTERVRGLLCGICNIMLGRLDDNPQAFLRVIEYLKNTTDLRNTIPQEPSMARFIDAAGNVQDTLGQSQPLSAANTAYQAADSVPPTNSNSTPVADFKYTDPLTFSVIASRG